MIRSSAVPSLNTRLPSLATVPSMLSPTFSNLMALRPCPASPTGHFQNPHRGPPILLRRSHTFMQLACPGQGSNLQGPRPGLGYRRITSQRGIALRLVEFRPARPADQVGLIAQDVRAGPAVGSPADDGADPSVRARPRLVRCASCRRPQSARGPRCALARIQVSRRCGPTLSASSSMLRPKMLTPQVQSVRR